MALNMLGLSVMDDTKDRLRAPRSSGYSDGLLTQIHTDLAPTHIDVTVPMNYISDCTTEGVTVFSIEPATYAAQWNDKIHALGMNVYWRGTSCDFEGIYDFTKKSKRNGNRYTFFGDNITDDFSSSSTRTHGYGKTSAGGNLSTNYLTSHQSGNSWTITSGELVGPTANGWVRTCLFNAPNLRNVVMVAKVKKVGNQQIIVRATTDSNFPGYGLQMRDTNVLRIERPGLENLGEVSKTWVNGNYYWLKLEATGTTIRGKAWLDGDSEPGSWDISVTNSTYTNGYCGFSGESNNGVFDDMTITPSVDTSSWTYEGCDWIRDNMSIFSSGDLINPYPEFSLHQSLTNEGSPTQFFTDLKYIIERLGTDAGKNISAGYFSLQADYATQGAYDTLAGNLGAITSDHYGYSIGLNKRFLSSSSNGGSTETFSGSNTYTFKNALSETSTDKRSFIPEKMAYNETFDIRIVTKPTSGDLKVEFHDSNNNKVTMPSNLNVSNLTTLDTITIPNASMSNNTTLTITGNWHSLITDQTFHVHIWSTDGTGTVLVSTASDLSTLKFNQYKCNTNPESLEIDIRNLVQRTGVPFVWGEFGDFWSTDSSRSDPVRTQVQHEAYIDTLVTMKQRLVDDGTMVGWCYWRATGGHESIYSNTGGNNFALTYEGQRWKLFYDANQSGSSTGRSNISQARVTSTGRSLASGRSTATGRTMLY